MRASQAEVKRSGGYWFAHVALSGGIVHGARVSH